MEEKCDYENRRRSRKSVRGKIKMTNSPERRTELSPYYENLEIGEKIAEALRISQSHY
jgi:hypothetical protein